MTSPRIHPPRTGRAEPPEISELRRLRHDEPDLASAVDLQIAIVQLQVRVKARLSTPWIEASPAWLKREHEEGRPLLRFEDLPVDWTEVRLMFRQTIDLLRRFELVEPEVHAQLQALGRDGPAIEAAIVRWFNLRAASGRVASGPWPEEVSPEALDQVLTLSMRPFLERAAEAAQPRADLSTWTRPYCPFCGGEPELAVITRSAERLLICGRCGARWAFDALRCPWCDNADRSALTSFASRDGQYRVLACEKCRRYMKAFDARGSSRPVMPAVDTIATLPLDAAAMQKGYQG